MRYDSLCITYYYCATAGAIQSSQICGMLKRHARSVKAYKTGRKEPRSTIYPPMPTSEFLQFFFFLFSFIFQVQSDPNPNARSLGTKHLFHSLTHDKLIRRVQDCTDAFKCSWCKTRASELSTSTLNFSHLCSEKRNAHRSVCRHSFLHDLRLLALQPSHQSNKAQLLTAPSNNRRTRESNLRPRPHQPMATEAP